MARAKHPLRSTEDGRAWQRDAVLAYLLPLLETMSLPDALERGFIDADGKRHGLPTLYTIGQWADQEPQLAAAIARARELRAHHLAEEALRITDEEPPRDNRGQYDRGHVRWAESRANQRKWLAERLNPKQYGAKLQHDVHHHGAIDVRQVLQDARSRVIEGTANREEPPAILHQEDDVSDLFD